MGPQTLIMLLAQPVRLYRPAAAGDAALGRGVPQPNPIVFVADSSSAGARLVTSGLRALRCFRSNLLVVVATANAPRKGGASTV